MKRNVLSIFIPLFILISGMSRSQQVISSAGTHVVETNVQLSWTVGEPVIETFNAGGHILTQGFHQSKLTITAIDPVEFPGLSISVFPNPVSSFIRLEVTGEGLNNLSFQLADMNGKILLSSKVESLPGMINMEPFAPGSYLLCIFRNSVQSLKSFKIIKN